MHALTFLYACRFVYISFEYEVHITRTQSIPYSSYVFFPSRFFSFFSLLFFLPLHSGRNKGSSERTNQRACDRTAFVCAYKSTCLHSHIFLNFVFLDSSLPRAKALELNGWHVYGSLPITIHQTLIVPLFGCYCVLWHLIRFYWEFMTVKRH